MFTLLTMPMLFLCLSPAQQPGQPEPFLRLGALPENLTFPLPEGKNHLLTVTVEGGNVKTVWLAPAKESRGRVLLTKSGKHDYQINLADPLVLTLLKGDRSGLFRIFAEVDEGTVLSSAAVSYALAKEEPAPTHFFVTPVEGTAKEVYTGRTAWLSLSQLTGLEVRGEPGNAASARAVVDDQDWPLQAMQGKGVWRLELTKEIRQLWEKHGALTLTYRNGQYPQEVYLHARPGKLAPEPVSMTILQRQAKDVPGSNGYLRVVILDITAEQVLLSLRNAEQQTLIDTRPVREGDELTFRYEREEYLLTVDKLVNFLIGEDYGVFRITSAAVGNAVREKTERLIQHVKKSNLTFLRDGKTYTGVEAAEHLRTKGELLRPPARTVADFIDRVGSRSSVSSQEYEVQLADGTKVKAGDWLREQVRQLEKESANPRK